LIPEVEILHPYREVRFASKHPNIRGLQDTMNHDLMHGSACAAAWPTRAGTAKEWVGPSPGDEHRAHARSAPRWISKAEIARRLQIGCTSVRRVLA
jgi:hypothetical protein